MKKNNAKDLKALIMQAYELKAIDEIESLTKFPVNEEEYEDLVHSYLRVVESDPTIIQRKKEIGSNMAEGYWLKTIQSVKGLQRFIDLMSNTKSYCFLLNGKVAKHWLTTDGIKFSKDGKTKSTSKELSAFCKACNNAKLVLNENEKEYVIYDISISENEVLFEMI